MFTKNLLKNKEKLRRTLKPYSKIQEPNIPNTHVVQRKFINSNQDPAYEKYSNQNLYSRISTVKETDEFLCDYEIKSLGQLCEKKPAQRSGSSSYYAVIGVLKGAPQLIEKSAGDKCLKFIICDLKGHESVVLCFSETIYDLDRYQFGYLVAVKSPLCSIYNKVKDQPLAFLTVKSQEQLMLIGKSRVAGYCVAKDKDLQCTEVIDTEKNSLCDFHLADAYQVSRRKRALFMESTTPTVLLPQKSKKIKAESVDIPYSVLGKI